MEPFEELDHTADWAFRARGHDLRELFVNAARGMFYLQGSSESGGETVTREFAVEGFDRETLLVNWLNELLYLQEQHREQYQRFEIVEFSERRLRARIHGGPQGNVNKLIKAVTFHGLHIHPVPGGWEADIVVDV
jgi:SHS2 domain-containing protein